MISLPRMRLIQGAISCTFMGVCTVLLQYLPNLSTRKNTLCNDCSSSWTKKQSSGEERKNWARKGGWNAVYNASNSLQGDVRARSTSVKQVAGPAAQGMTPGRAECVAYKAKMQVKFKLQLPVMC